MLPVYSHAVTPAAPVSRARMIDRQISLAREWDGLVEEVRQLGQEFVDFLRPPRISSLLPGTDRGAVVVVNVTPSRCDALIVSAAGVRALPLPDLTFAATQDMAHRHLERLMDLESSSTAVQRGQRWAGEGLNATAFHELHQAKLRLQRATVALDAHLTEVMAWLWRAVADPVLTAMGHTAAAEPATAPRLWWCPTGPLAFLPLHAAGRHDGTGHSVMDRVASSYTPTLRALAQTTAGPTRGGEDRMLVVAVPEPEGEVALPQADGEVDILSRLLPEDRLTVLRGEAATRAAVLAALPRHRWAHFSCHARQRLGDPSNGGFLVHDGPLTVRELGLGRHTGDFGMLSACMTATGGLRLTDEVLTLAASLHYTGFRHVLATLWSVDAGVALRWTEVVYQESIVDGVLVPSRSAFAAHQAVHALRAAAVGRPSRWALFTHTGP
jgi:hypothetical protein